MIARTVTESRDSPGLMLPHADLRTAAVRAIHATIDGARWAIWLSALRVSRVLSAALVLARDLGAVSPLDQDRARVVHHVVGSPRELQLEPRRLLVDRDLDDVRGRSQLDATARRWRWLTAALFDPYRPERHYIRGPGPKWREKHARGAGS